MAALPRSESGWPAAPNLKHCQAGTGGPPAVRVPRVTVRGLTLVPALAVAALALRLSLVQSSLSAGPRTGAVTAMITEWPHGPVTVTGGHRDGRCPGRPLRC